MKPATRRALSVLVSLCLLAAPVGAWAQEPTTHTASDSPVYRSDFSLKLSLNADGFPKGTTRDYGAWQDYLSKLSLHGVIDVQDFLTEFSRVYFDGGLYVGEKKALPFTYDGYYSFRYVRSPALDGKSVHFQMHNFLEFMLKPYYFMELPTQYIALFMYPEATEALYKAYSAPISAALSGTGERVIPYETLAELAATLDAMQQTDEDSYYRVYFYVTCLLTALGASDEAYEKLGCLEDWLQFLDPDMQGLRVSADAAGGESWVIGEYEVLKSAKVEGGCDWTLTLPDADGRELRLSWRYVPQEINATLNAALSITAEGEERVGLKLDIDKLPKPEDTEAFGTATITASGAAINEGAMRFDFRYQRDAATPPYAVSLGVDIINPETNAAALTLTYRADVSEHDNTILVDRAIDDQDDFFHLNESVLEEYKQRFLPTMALGLVPFVLEMPTPVFNDITSWLTDSGALGIIGLE